MGPVDALVCAPGVDREWVRPRLSPAQERTEDEWAGLRWLGQFVVGFSVAVGLSAVSAWMTLGVMVALVVSFLVTPLVRARRRERSGPVPGRDYIGLGQVLARDEPLLQRLSRVVDQVAWDRVPDVDGVRLRVQVPELAWRLAQALVRVHRTEQAALRVSGTDTALAQARGEVSAERSRVRGAVRELERLLRTCGDVEHLEELRRAVEEMRVHREGDRAFGPVWGSLEEVRQVAREVARLNRDWGGS